MIGSQGISPEIARVAEETVLNLKQLESRIEVLKNDLAHLCAAVGHPEAARLAVTPVPWLRLGQFASPYGNVGSFGPLGSISPYGNAGVSPYQGFGITPYSAPTPFPTAFATPFGNPLVTGSPFTPLR
jgi:hypothetical protein